MQKVTALVSGASGFVGSHLCCELVKNNFKVYALCSEEDIKNKEFADFVEQNKIEVVKGNVVELDIEVLPKVNYVYHTEEKKPTLSSMQEFAKVNVVGTKNMLEYAKLCPKLKSFVYVSSVTVYGFNGYSNLREDAEFLPMNNNYPISKILAEEEVKRVAEENKFDYVIVRCGNVYGEYDLNFSYDACEKGQKQKVVLYGGGIYETSFVYVGNLVSAIAYLSKTKSAYNNDYNITDGSSFTLERYYSMLAKALGIQSKFKKESVWLSKLNIGIKELCSQLFKTKEPIMTKFKLEQYLRDFSFSMQKTFETKFRCPYTAEEGVNNLAHWFKSIKEEEKK